MTDTPFKQESQSKSEKASTINQDEPKRNNRNEIGEILKISKGIQIGKKESSKLEEFPKQ